MVGVSATAEVEKGQMTHVLSGEDETGAVARYDSERERRDTGQMQLLHVVEEDRVEGQNGLAASGNRRLLRLEHDVVESQLGAIHHLHILLLDLRQHVQLQIYP